MIDPPTRSISPLNYAPAAPMRRRRWLRRLFAMVVLLAIAFAGRKWGPDTWRRASLLYWQHACLTYSSPADQVVIEFDPGRVAKLTSDPNYTIENGCAVLRPMKAWYRLQGERCLVNHWRVPTIDPFARLFVHQLHTPDGTNRLICVEADGDILNNHARYTCLASVLVAGTWTKAPEEVTWYDPTNLALPNSLDVPLDFTSATCQRVYAGQIDPADSAHFTIRYITNAGEERHVDFRLIDGRRIAVQKPPELTRAGLPLASVARSSRIAVQKVP